MIGLAPFVDLAYGVWRRAHPELALERSLVAQAADYTFDEAALPTGAVDAVVAFVAIDNRFLNFKRLELIGLLAARGVRLETIVGLHAVLGDGATLGANVLVGEGAIVGDGAAIGDGACLGARVVIGPGAIIERGAWIEPGVVIGARARVGAQTTVTSGVVIADAAEIGALCVLAVPGLVRGEIAPRTYLHPAFDEPIRILG